MTTYYDVPADQLISSLSSKLKETGAVTPPEWTYYVKTGTHKERPPVQDDWWFIRSAAIFRKVAIKGPIGTNRMSQEFGGSKNRGVKRNKAVSGSRNITRKILQQLSDSNLIMNSMNSTGTVNRGKILSPSGQSLIDSVANDVRPLAEERFPELSRY
tara:strand:- start:56 stop:526 length:471 start_codon:yes stop_codon:yes gene_type:complete